MTYCGHWASLQEARPDLQGTPPEFHEKLSLSVQRSCIRIYLVVRNELATKIKNVDKWQHYFTTIVSRISHVALTNNCAIIGKYRG